MSIATKNLRRAGLGWKSSSMTEELEPVSVRLQAAVVRALADHVERLPRGEDVEALSQQLGEERARLEVTALPQHS